MEQADGGTLFLDEIGELPLTAQKVFLRVLQERYFRPVGGKTEKKSNFRLIAATNRDLAKMVQKGSFRKDLYYRINSQSIVLPPLREHLEDIPVIAVHHSKRLSRVYEVGEKKLSPDFMETLQAYSWPGNIRELVNILETVVTSVDGVKTLYSKHLPTHIRVQKTVRSLPVRKKGRPEQWHAAQSLPPLKTFRKTAAEKAERHYLHDLLSVSGRDIANACHISGLSRSRLYEILKKHQMTDSPIP